MLYWQSCQLPHMFLAVFWHNICRHLKVIQEPDTLNGRRKIIEIMIQFRSNERLTLIADIKTESSGL